MLCRQIPYKFGKTAKITVIVDHDGGRRARNSINPQDSGWFNQS